MEVACLLLFYYFFSLFFVFSNFINLIPYCLNRVNTPISHFGGVIGLVIFIKTSISLHIATSNVPLLLLLLLFPSVIYLSNPRPLINC